MTLHCSSFSKCLVSGFRIGWVAAGKHAPRIQQLQFMSTLSTSSPMQLAIVDYLATRSYEQHLRKLRQTLSSRKKRIGQILQHHLPGEVSVHYNEGGYFLWLELPKNLDASELSKRTLAQGISIAPGKMFSTSDLLSHCFRINTSWEWGEKEETAAKKMGEIIRRMIGQSQPSGQV